MRPQWLTICKRLFAKFTFVWFAVHVGIHMSFKMCLHLETLVTNVTVVAVGSPMARYMLRQSVVTTECFLTVTAYEACVGGNCLNPVRSITFRHFLCATLPGCNFLPSSLRFSLTPERAVATRSRWGREHQRTPIWTTGIRKPFCMVQKQVSQVYISSS